MVKLCTRGVITALLLCTAVTDLLAQFRNRPNRRFPSRLPARSRQVSRSFGVRSRLQTGVSSPWLRDRPRLSEVSVPSIQRSTLTTRGVIRTPLRASRFGNFGREITPTRRTTRLSRLPRLFRRRRLPTRRMLMGRGFQRFFPRNSIINNNNNNNNNRDNNNNLNYYNSNPSLRRLEPSPVRVRSVPRVSDPSSVRVRSVPRVSDGIRVPIVVRARPARPAPIVTVRSSPSSRHRARYDLPVVLSRRRMRRLRGGAPRGGHAGSVVVRRGMSGQPALPTVVLSRPKVVPVVYDTANTNVPTITLTKSDIPPVVYDVTKSLSSVTPVKPSAPKIVTQTSTGTVDTPIHTVVNDAGTQVPSSVSNTQMQHNGGPVTQTGTVTHAQTSLGAPVQPAGVGTPTQVSQPTGDAFHKDLVDVFTQVIEGYLTPQGSVGQAVSPPVAPIPAPATIVHSPTQPVSPYSQYNPYNPYNPYGQMTSFGFMNPWMSPAMMQEMWYGDPNDPPDTVTTTTAPANTTSINNVTDTAVNTAAIDVTVPDTGTNTAAAIDVTVPETNTNTDVIVNDPPIDTTTIDALLDVTTTQEPQVTVHAASDGQVEGTEVKLPVTDTNINVEVNVKTETSRLVKITDTNPEGLNSVADIKPKQESTNRKGPSQSVKIKANSKTTQPVKTLGGSEQLLVDIATLIRQSKVDIARFSSIIEQSHQTHVTRGHSTAISHNISEPIVEDIPTAAQLGIKLPDHVIAEIKAKKSTDSPSPVPSTHSPSTTPMVPNLPVVPVSDTVPSLPVVPVSDTVPVPSLPVVPVSDTIPPSTPSTRIPKGLVFTRQPEIYRTLSTILKHNPDAVRKAFTTDPTPPVHRTNTTATSDSLAVRKAFTTDPTPPVHRINTTATSDSLGEVTNEVVDNANNEVSVPVRVDQTKDVLSADTITVGGSVPGLVDKPLNGQLTIDDNIQIGSEPINVDRSTDNSSKIQEITPHENVFTLTDAVNETVSISAIASEATEPDLSNVTLSDSSPVEQADIPVLANVIVDEVKSQVINVKETINHTNRSEKIGYALHEQLKKITDSSSGTGGLDLVNYLADPSFVNILRQSLLKLTKQHTDTSTNRSPKPESTTSIPLVSTTMDILSTTEEYELEDYVTEGMMTTTLESTTIKQ